MEKTERDIVETILINIFPGIVKPISAADIEIINSFKDASFGLSFLGIMLYANGHNLRGKSTLYPQGLLYYDGENIFGIGFFKKTYDEPHGHLFLIAPRGKTWNKAIKSFVERVRQIAEIPQETIYVRYLSKSQYTELTSNKFHPVQNDPWSPVAHSEDETYNHCLINLDDILAEDSNSNIAIKKLKGPENRRFRLKARRAYGRFNNFLNHNSLKLSIEQYNAEIHKDLAKDIVISNFKDLNEVVGSSPEDYFNLVNLLPHLVNSDIFFARIGFLQSKDERIPVMLFIGEKIDSDTVALYASFALRKNQIVYQKYEATGYSAISQYCYLRYFEELRKYHIKYVNLGGSETKDLDRFKRQFGAREVRTYWAIANMQ